MNSEAMRGSVAADLDEIHGMLELFNKGHDSRGRFASGGGGGRSAAVEKVAGRVKNMVKVSSRYKPGTHPTESTKPAKPHYGGDKSGKLPHPKPPTAAQKVRMKRIDKAYDDREMQQMRIGIASRKREQERPRTPGELAYRANVMAMRKQAAKSPAAQKAEHRKTRERRAAARKAKAGSSTVTKHYAAKKTAMAKLSPADRKAKLGKWKKDAG